jgi:hypothetical protein
MAVQDAVPSEYQGHEEARPIAAGASGLGCPSCGKDDAVRAVPAIYESSRTAEQSLARARSVIRDDDASLGRKRQARALVAATPAPTVGSALLAPTPRSRAAAFAVGTVFLAFPAGILWAMYRSSKSFTDSTGLAAAGEGDGVLRTVAAICAAASAACLVGALVSLARRARIRGGRPAAEAVWRRGWYCGRCAVVHFRSGQEPAGLSPGQALHPDEFRELVWTVGGYGRRTRRS